MQLIREYSMHEHQVAFYAEKLCISSRYLHKVTVRHLDGKKPKQLIDEQLVAEIKVLLNEPRLSVTEIAEQLHFPDLQVGSQVWTKWMHEAIKNLG